MSIKINKNNKEYPLGFVPQHYPADRVYRHGNVNENIDDAFNLVKAPHNVGIFNVDSVNKEYGQFAIAFNIASTGTTYEIDCTSIIPASLADDNKTWVSEGFLQTSHGTLPINFTDGSNYILGYCERGKLHVKSNQWTGDGYAIIKYLKN